LPGDINASVPLASTNLADLSASHSGSLSLSRGQCRLRYVSAAVRPEAFICSRLGTMNLASTSASASSGTPKAL
jgi:hypothetical protein